MALYTAIFSERLATLQERMKLGELDDRNYRLLNIHLAIKEHIGAYRERPKNDDLYALAEMILNEELSDKHPDKMAREEYPFMSEHQEKHRFKREKSISDIKTGVDDATIGRKLDHDGIKRRIYDYMTPKRDMALIPAKYLDLYNALDNAGLTQKQLEVIDLVYFEGMTQEDAADVLGINKSNVNAYLKAALKKLRLYLRKLDVV